jgi:hypothetical protein
MIQRIQTIWLLLVSALSFLTLQTSVYSGHRINDIIPKPMIFLSAAYNPLLNITTIAVGVISLITIFLFKYRKLQIRLSIVALLLSFTAIALYYWQSKSFITEESSITITAFIPVLIPVILIIAIRKIWKDEKLVKGSDRLR